MAELRSSVDVNSLISSFELDAGNIVTTTVFLGATIFALFAALALVRERGRALKENTALKSQLADLLAQNEQSSALIDVDDQRVVLWRDASAAPVILGDLPGATGVPVDRNQFLAFGRWLVAESAASLDAAIDRLRRRAEGFDLTLNSVAGACIEAQGRTSGGAAFVRFVDLTGDRAVLAQLEGEHRQLAGTLETVQSLLETLDIPAWLRSSDGRLVWVNDHYLKAVGAGSVDAVVANGTELVPSADRQAASQALASTGAYRARISTIISGSRKFMDIVESKSASGFAGIAMDASEAEDAKSAMARLRQAHDQTLDQITSAVATFDTSRTLIFYNSAFQALWELPPAFLDGRPKHDEVLERLRRDKKISEPNDWKGWKEEHLSVYSGTDSYEVLMHLPDGRTVHVVATPQRGGGVTWVLENLTDQLELEGRYDTLADVQGESLEHLVEGVAVFGSDGRLRLSNSAFGAMWQLEDEQRAAGTHIAQLAEAFAEADGSQSGAGHHWLAFASEITGLRDQRVQSDRQISLPSADGESELVYDCALVPLPDAQTMITFVDITDSVNVANALTERNEALEAAEVMKNAFVANMSYELRTLLTNIKGFTEVLLSRALGDLNDSQTEYMQNVHNSADKLESIVDSMLDLASIDAGLLELEVDQVELEPLLGEVRVKADEELKAKNMSLTTELGEGAGVLQADRRRLVQILTALLSNAIQFSPEGGRIRMVSSANAEGICLSVSDEGPGITPEFAKTAFNRFEAENAGDVRKGAGLGLAVVRSLMDLHGGSVQIERSESGQAGTTITCLFPRNITSKEAPPAPVVQSVASHEDRAGG
jgi:signal transduction histidine kinase/PAS domain-containing protein